MSKLCECSCSGLTENPRFINGHNHVKNLKGKVFGQLSVIEADWTRGLRWLCQCACGNRVCVRGHALRAGKTDCGGPAHLNLIGQRFEKLVVQNFAGSKNGDRFWRCKCDCGNLCEIPTERWGRTKSCGCARSRFTDLTGQKFNHLTAIKLIDRGGTDQPATWLCKCDCGNTTTVKSVALRCGNTKSCGCLNKELAGSLATKFLTKHGHARTRQYSPEWKSWRNMLARCLNPRNNRYSYYGALGIKVRDRWQGEHGFENFLADMGPRPQGTTLGRFKDLGNYEPDNCEWMTPKEQWAERRKKQRLLGKKPPTRVAERIAEAA